MLPRGAVHLGAGLPGRGGVSLPQDGPRQEEVRHWRAHGRTEPATQTQGLGILYVNPAASIQGMIIIISPQGP